MTSQHFVHSRVCEPPASSLTPFKLPKETDVAQVTKHRPGWSRELGARWGQHLIHGTLG